MLFVHLQRAAAAVVAMGSAAPTALCPDLAVDDEVVALDLDDAVVLAVDRVILELVRHVLGRGTRVDEAELLFRANSCL